MAVALSAAVAITSFCVPALAAETDAAQGEKLVYATVNLPYADYYYGELNNITAGTSFTIDLSVDKAASYRETGMYDAVTSATTQKGAAFTTADATISDNQTLITGVKDAKIAIPQELYENLKTYFASYTDDDPSTESIVDRIKAIFDAMTISETPFSEYKVLNADGTFSETVVSETAGYEAETVDADATATISVTATGGWGTHQIDFENLTLPDGVTGSALIGAILETSDGTKYGMLHLENTWLNANELSFATEQFTERKGNSIGYKRTQDLVGKTITKITYLVDQGSDIVVNCNLKVKEIINRADSANNTVTATDVAAGSSTSNITLSAPDAKDASYRFESLTYDGKEVDGYTYADGVLTLPAGASVGTYTVTFADDKYESLSTTFDVLSSMKAEDVTFIDQKLVINNSEVTLADYIAAIDGVSVDGVSIDRISGSMIFNEDGSINYDAEQNFHGNKTTIFPQGADGTYELVIHASGYVDVTVTVGKDSAITPPETPDQTPEANVKKPAKVTKTSIAAVTKTSMKVTWKKVSGATGYQIRYSKKSTFKNAKTVNVKTVSKKLTKLTKKTKYYVQVRAYKTATVNGEKTTIYGNWSATKTAKTK
jgi:hypothetical protein